MSTDTLYVFRHGERRGPLPLRRLCLSNVFLLPKRARDVREPLTTPCQVGLCGQKLDPHRAQALGSPAHRQALWIWRTLSHLCLTRPRLLPAPAPTRSARPRAGAARRQAPRQPRRQGERRSRPRPSCSAGRRHPSPLLSQPRPLWPRPQHTAPPPRHRWLESSPPRSSGPSRRLTASRRRSAATASASSPCAHAPSLLFFTPAPLSFSRLFPRVVSLPASPSASLHNNVPAPLQETPAASPPALPHQPAPHNPAAGPRGGPRRGVVRVLALRGGVRARLAPGARCTAHAAATGRRVCLLQSSQPPPLFAAARGVGRSSPCASTPGGASPRAWDSAATYPHAHPPSVHQSAELFMPVDVLREGVSARVDPGYTPVFTFEGRLPVRRNFALGRSVSGQLAFLGVCATNELIAKQRPPRADGVVRRRRNRR